VAEEGLVKATRQSSQPSPPRVQRASHSGRQEDSAAREENGTLMVLSCRAAVAKDWGGFAPLGRMGLSLKAAVDRQVCGTMDPAQGRRHGAKAHRRTEIEGSQHPMRTAEQPSRLKMGGTDDSVHNGLNAGIWCSQNEQLELI